MATQNKNQGTSASYINRIQKKYGTIEIIYGEIIAPTENKFATLLVYTNEDAVEKINKNDKISKAEKEKLLKEYEKEMIKRQKENLDHFAIIQKAIQTPGISPKDKAAATKRLTELGKNMLNLAKKALQIMEKKQEPATLIKAVKNHIEGLSNLGKQQNTKNTSKSTAAKTTAKKPVAKKAVTKKTTAKKAVKH